MPGAVKFVMPTIADGYIFVAGGEGYPNWYFGSAGQCQAGTTLSCAGQLTILH